MKLLILLILTSCGYENASFDWMENVARKEHIKMTCKELATTLEEYENCVARRSDNE